MHLKIMAVGKMKSGPERELYARYAERIEKSGRHLHLYGPELIEISESRHSAVAARKTEEAVQLLKRAGEAPRIILLDEAGKDISSNKFSELIKTEQQLGTKSLVFAIGGPDGHGEELKKAAHLKVRFGTMTWPHQIVRFLLVEQIYRAITILSGHPYHRE